MKAPFEYNVRLFSHSSQGGRKYMEDTFCVAYQKKSDKKIQDDVCHEGLDRIDNVSSEGTGPERGNCFKQVKQDLEYVFAGIYDGHGGNQAAEYTRDNLLTNIISQKDFWSSDDQLILKAIKDGFLATHYGMLKEVVNWPQTATGLPSTAGTTASVCFIMNNKYYTGHVGDSKIVLGKKNKETGMWIPYPLTRDHKPDSPEERKRIYDAGGEVMNKSGVERVVWYRPKNGHKGPIRRSTNIDRIPFLAVARSLGDLWSYNPETDIYVVSPEPDVEVIPIDADEDKCLVLASDGLWNMLLEHECIRLIQEMEEPFEVDRDLLNSLYNPGGPMDYYQGEPTNPSEALVSFALQRWFSSRLRADNTSVLTLLLDHRGPAAPVEKKPILELSDDELAALVNPVVLPSQQFATEYLISPDHQPSPNSPTDSRSSYDDNNLENIPVANTSFPFNSYISPQHAFFHGPPRPSENTTESAENYSMLSPAMQSLCELAKGESSFNGDNKRTEIPCSEEHNIPNDFALMKPTSAGANLYVNELPEESFQALSNALKMKNGRKMHKIISGVKVFKDFDSPSESDESTDETGVEKKHRDECVGVNEETLDNGVKNTSLHEVSGIANAWSLPPAKGDAHGTKGVEKSRSAPAIVRPCSTPPSTRNYLNIERMKDRASFFRRRFISGDQRKRKHSCSHYSPPSKHLRSSRWSRAKLNLMPSNTSNVCKRWRTLAASIMTRSRLRARKAK